MSKTSTNTMMVFSNLLSAKVIYLIGHDFVFFGREKTEEREDIAK